MSSSSWAPIYPRRYFDKSPTWFAWNRLTAADVHRLRTERGFEGQNVYFHLNHPIRFVRLVGLVVGIESVFNGKYTLITLDDASGRCIVVKIVRRDTTGEVVGDTGISGVVDAAADASSSLPSNTFVDNLHVFVEMGLPRVVVDRKVVVDVGTILRVKGTIENFREQRQIELKMVAVVGDTNEETASWIDTAKWKRDILSRPWVLTEEEKREVDELLREEERSEKEKAKKRREWNQRHDEKKRAHEEKKEAKRSKQEKMYNAGALDGSHLLPAPWD